MTDLLSTDLLSHVAGTHQKNPENTAMVDLMVVSGQRLCVTTTTIVVTLFTYPVLGLAPPDSIQLQWLPLPIIIVRS